MKSILKSVTKIFMIGAMSALIAAACGINVYAGDIVVRTVNVGMSGSNDRSGAVIESYPVCYATNQYDEYFTQTSSYAIDTAQTSFSRSFENWKAGEPVNVHVTIVPKAGYTFNSSATVVNVIGKNTKIESKNITAGKIKVLIKYWPSVVLPEIDPNTVRTDDEDEYTLVWDPVTVNGGEWKYYQVRVMSDDAGSKSVVNKQVSTHKADLSDMIADGNHTIAIRTVGGTSAKERYTVNSDWVILGDNMMENSASIPGVFSGTGDKIVYLDESGNMISGWVEINGCWYYFDPDNKNRAVVNNFKQIDGKWYFFADNGIMQMGWVEYDGNKYYMHTISDGNGGVMETGWISTGPDGPYYFFNDGSIPGLPLGALLKNGITPDGHTVDENGKRVD